MKLFKFILFIFIFCLFWSLTLFLPALAQTVSLTPASQEQGQNSIFSLDVNIGSVANLFGVAFDISFNPALVSYVGASEGSFLSPNCQTSLMSAENPSGNLIVGLTRLGASCGGVSGAGKLITLNFKSLSQNGLTNFSFSNNTLCLLQNSDCNYITGIWQPASVTVSNTGSGSCPVGSGDINCDQIVNISDMTLAIGIFFESNTDVVQKARADLNNDGQVNILDIQKIINISLGL